MGAHWRYEDERRIELFTRRHQRLCISTPATALCSALMPASSRVATCTTQHAFQQCKHAPCSAEATHSRLAPLWGVHAKTGPAFPYLVAHQVYGLVWRPVRVGVSHRDPCIQQPLQHLRDGSNSSSLIASAVSPQTSSLQATNRWWRVCLRPPGSRGHPAASACGQRAPSPQCKQRKQPMMARTLMSAYLEFVCVEGPAADRPPGHHKLPHQGRDVRASMRPAGNTDR